MSNLFLLRITRILSMLLLWLIRYAHCWSVVPIRKLCCSISFFISNQMGRTFKPILLNSLFLIKWTMKKDMQQKTSTECAYLCHSFLCLFFMKTKFYSFLLFFANFGAHCGHNFKVFSPFFERRGQNSIELCNLLFSRDYWITTNIFFFEWIAKTNWLRAPKAIYEYMRKHCFQVQSFNLDLRCCLLFTVFCFHGFY